jgi:PucR family transcriptional regulator, purine catabolism regulatory protein
MSFTEPRPPTLRLASTGTLTYGLSVGEVLGVSALSGARVIAGAGGLDRVVQRLNVMEVPDILAWVKPHELLLTTGYPLRNTPQSLAHLVADLDERSLAALAIKLGRYLDGLPGEMIEQADRLDFPLILLAGDVGFDDILNQVLTDILNRQAAILARSEEAHRALVQIVLGGGGLQEITDEVAALLGGAVAVIDRDGRELAASGNEGHLARLRTEPYPPGARDTTAGYGAHGDRTVVPVVAGGHTYGRMTAVGESAPDIGMLERAATVAALVITKQQAVAAVESKYRADFLRDVLTGRSGGAEHVIEHSASFGWDLDRPVNVVVAEIDRGPEDRTLQDRLVAAVASAVRRRDRKGAVAGFSHEVVAVLGAEQCDVAALAKDAAAVFAESGRTFSAGVSRTAKVPGELPAAYDQAVKAVHVGRQLHGDGAVAHFDQLGVFRLLSLVGDTDELHAFVRETLGELAGDGDPEALDLRRTLQVLLETNLNVAETARRLHFHYNTLRYRIGKLERLLGPFTDDAHLRLNLTLALHVLRMRGI